MKLLLNFIWIFIVFYLYTRTHNEILITMYCTPYIYFRAYVNFSRWIHSELKLHDFSNGNFLHKFYLKISFRRAFKQIGIQTIDCRVAYFCNPLLPAV